MDLTPTAAALLARVTERRIPAPIGTATEELVSLGLVRPFRDGAGTWLELVDAEDRDEAVARYRSAGGRLNTGDHALDKAVLGQRTNTAARVLAEAEHRAALGWDAVEEAAAFDRDLDVELLTGQLLVAMPGQLELT